MKTLALNRLHILGFSKGEGMLPQDKITFLSELARLGYTVSNPEKLDEVSDDFFTYYGHLLSDLEKMRGGDVTYVPLFSNFPNLIPEDGPYFIKRIIGYLANILEDMPDAVELSNGTRVPKWLFDHQDFGADPITQMQSEDLFQAAAEADKAKAGDSHVEWIKLTIMVEEEMLAAIRTYMLQLLYAKSSIRQSLQEETEKLMDHFGLEELEGEKLIHKENKSFVLKYLWKRGEFERVVELTKTPTELLRLFAALTGSDTSLANRIRFPKLSRAARRAVLQILEKSPALAEDLHRYERLWLQIGRYLHPGSYQKDFPKSAEAFDRLRNGKIASYNSRTESLIQQADVAALLKHLNKRPGVLARKLHELLRRFPKHTQDILAVFHGKEDRLALKNLFVMKAYFNSINSAENRTIVNKKGKMKILPNNAINQLTVRQLEQTTQCLDQLIDASLRSRDSWEEQKVWIDPVLVNYTLPLQQRAASESLHSLARGTRVHVDAEKVIRLFVYWREESMRTDLDLSVILFDADFKYADHVSYTNLKTYGIRHSGDIQSAPLGAAEFVDIKLDEMAEHVRYVAIQVYKYAGNNFDEMAACHVGWMMREKVDKSIKSFDIKTVTQKYDLNRRAAYAIPLIVDLEAQEVILTDLYMNGREMHNRVEGTYGAVALVASEITQFVKTRPVLSDLATAHVRARGAILTTEKEEADISFGVHNCDYNANEIEKILAELI